MCQRALYCHARLLVGHSLVDENANQLEPPLEAFREISSASRWSASQVTIGRLGASRGRYIHNLLHGQYPRRSSTVKLVDNTHIRPSPSQTRHPEVGVSPYSRHFCEHATNLESNKDYTRERSSAYRIRIRRETISQDVQLLGLHFCLICCNWLYV